METFKSFESLLNTVNDQSYNDFALSLFQFQAKNNPVYNQYILNLGVYPESVTSVDQIPFLPISFFKNQGVKTGTWKEETCFMSSGTTGAITSKHAVKELDFYLNNAEKCFHQFFGNCQDYNFLAFLPSYMERGNSSLIAMIQHFIRASRSDHSGFYLNDIEKLLNDLGTLRKTTKKTILWGVSFALLELAEKYHPDLSHCLVFETGGMKGRRREITKAELHAKLKDALNIDVVYSEYGMTELFSQAYSKGDVFMTSRLMKVSAREMADPFNRGLVNETGALNVIDLANIHSVAFIETEDIGKVYKNGTFEVLGRMDNSDLRGCNLLIE